MGGYVADMLEGKASHDGMPARPFSLMPLLRSRISFPPRTRKLGNGVRVKATQTVRDDRVLQRGISLNSPIVWIGRRIKAATCNWILDRVVWEIVPSTLHIELMLQNMHRNESP